MLPAKPVDFKFYNRLTCLYDIFRECVREIVRQQEYKVDTSLGKFVNKVAVRSDLRPILRKREKKIGEYEMLEVINSFRDPIFIRAVKIEQVRALNLKTFINSFL